MFFMFFIIVVIVSISGCTTSSSPSQTGEKQTQAITSIVQTAAPTQGTMSMIVPSTTTMVSTTIPAKDTSTPAYTIRVEESNASFFTFSPGWRYRDRSGASGGSVAVTNYGAQGFTNIKVDVKFSGTGIALIHGTMPYGAIADVVIDGKNYPSIDMYANMEKPATSVIAADLENKEHILTISPSANHNPSVTLPPDQKNAIITVDAVEITRPV